MKKGMEDKMDDIQSFDDELIKEGVNPGSTADLIISGLFVALLRDEILIDIDDFGFHEGISEVILSTLSADCIPNAAPMGLHRKDGKLFAMIYILLHSRIYW